MGDLNSNAIWDQQHPAALNHSALVERLRILDLASAYHAFFAEKQGAETRPTYYHWRKQTFRHHIDYCFLPNEWTSGVRSVEVGVAEEWLGDSDHCPLIVDIDITLIGDG